MGSVVFDTPSTPLVRLLFIVVAVNATTVKDGRLFQASGVFPYAMNATLPLVSVVRCSHCVLALSSFVAG